MFDILFCKSLIKKMFYETSKNATIIISKKIKLNLIVSIIKC